MHETLTSPLAPSPTAPDDHRRGGRPIRVLIVDDSVLMRQAVRRLLSADPDIEVVDVARDGLEALAKSREAGAGRAHDGRRDAAPGRPLGAQAADGALPASGGDVEQPDGGRRRGDGRALALGAVDFMQKPIGAR